MPSVIWTGSGQRQKYHSQSLGGLVLHYTRFEKLEWIVKELFKGSF